jgi:hypothetical protein
MTQDKWKCTGCGEEVDTQFDICSICQAPRGDPERDIANDPSIPNVVDQTFDGEKTANLQQLDVHAEPQSALSLWLQIVTILALTQPFYSPAGRFLRWAVFTHPSTTFAVQWTHQIVFEAIVAAIALAMMWWSGEPWSTFGIKKPNWSIDIITGCLIFGIDRASSFVAADVFSGLLLELFGRDFRVAVARSYWIERPEGWAGAAGLLEQLTFIRSHVIC